MSQNKPTVNSPLWLLAELTYHCPLQHPYCSNPLNFTRREKELTTEQWIEVFRQMRAIDSVQLGSFDGKLLIRKDLPELIRAVRSLGFYTNLIIPGIGLAESKLSAFSEAGPDRVRISFQASDEVPNAALAGNKKTFQQKLAMARTVKARDHSMVLSFVPHQYSIDQLDRIIELCIKLEADDVELATYQFHDWASLNCEGLLSTREWTAHAEQVVAGYRQKMVTSGNLTNLLFVTPDYHEERPRGRMGGWGSIFLNVIPGGTALPCHSMRQLPMAFPSVLEQSLESIQYGSFGFNRYHGYDWMPGPHRSHSEKEKDLGGYRYQAFMLTGSADDADPVYSKSPHHHKILETRRETACSDIKVSRLQLCNRIRSQFIYKTREL